MAHRVDDRLKRCLEEAKHQRIWLRPSCEEDRVALQRRFRHGGAVRPFPGLYADRDRFHAMKPRARAVTTLRTLATENPELVFCRYSAALLHGLQLASRLWDEVDVVASTGHRRSSQSIRRHPRPPSGEPTPRMMGMRVTCLERTVMDCLRSLPLEDGLGVVDSALRFDLTSMHRLERFFDEHGRRRGIVQARETLSHADGLSENGGESYVRGVIIRLGFQLPELQVELFDPMEPGNPKRVDFLWRLPDGRLVAGELDGMGKYKAAGGLDGTVRRMSRERRRESHLNLGGVRVLRFSMGDVYDRAYFERLLTSAGIPRVGSAAA